MTKPTCSLCLLSISLLMLSCTGKSEKEPEQSIEFNIPENFVLEDLYRPIVHGQGSWVALAEGPNKELYACDQRGKIYYFPMPENGEVVSPKQVDSLDLGIGEAHGLLWAHNSLYVAVNKRWEDEVPDDQERGSGVYRIMDTDQNGELDDVKMLLRLEGDGEHGPHSFVPSPDGKEIFFIAGNYTVVPESVLSNSRLPTNWATDNLFPPYLDARGHANDVKPPGGWIAKFNPDGTDWELISSGYRNPFDIAFNQDGELFTYDADMEWDIGMPWYRPTRINHVTSGSEYGWRTGSGKWPDYYPDNLPAVHNLEQGSPTAVLASHKLSFPSKYGNGLFVMDWSFGTVYFIDLKPKGSSYTAEREEFFSGTPLPLTDMIAGTDGNLYFATGGRGLDSHLYRLRYTGENTGTVVDKNNTEAQSLRDLRQSIERFHSEQSEEAISIAWKNLNHSDRFIRYASRIALEHQPVEQWQNLFLKEKDPVKIIEAGIAMARQGDKALQNRILNTLNGLKLEDLPEQQLVAALRNYALVFIRMGQPREQQRKITIKKLNSHFPHKSNRVNRELGQLLLYLNADGITESLVGLLEKHTQEKTIIESVGMLSEETTLRSQQYGPLIREVIEKMPPSEAIYYGLLLSNAQKGWTKDARERYFLWFYDVLSAEGGMSFKAYMENVRQRAMAYVPNDEKEYFQEISGVYSPSTAVADLPQPMGPGKDYTPNEINQMLWEKNLEHYDGTFIDGERAYKSAMCVLCHRMRGEGGAAGPDLTQAYTKFSNYDMVFAIYSPNDEISDQYAHTLFHLKDGKKIAGRLLSEEGDSISLAPNPFNEGYRVHLAKKSIEKQELSPISPMPSGLLNRLNKREIQDLFVYLKSGGDKNHEVYQGRAGD